VLIKVRFWRFIGENIYTIVGILIGPSFIAKILQIIAIKVLIDPAGGIRNRK
jgi:hypothetical protein